MRLGVVNPEPRPINQTPDPPKELSDSAKFRARIAGTPLEWVGAISLGLVAWSGQLKQLPPFVFLPIDFTLLSTLVAVIVAATSLVRARRLPTIHALLLLSLLLLMGVVGAMTYVPGPQAADKVITLFLLTLVMTSCAAAIVRDRSAYLRFVAMFVLFGIAVSLSTLIVGQVTAQGRLTSAVGSTIPFGRAAGTVLVSIGAFLLTARKLRPIVTGSLLVLFGLEFFVLVSIASRGPFQAIGLAALFMFIMQLSRFRVALAFRISVLSAAAIAIGAVSWIRAPDFARERITGIFTGAAVEQGGGGRDSAFEWTWQRLTLDPIGNGWGSWPRDAEVPFFSYVHNIFLELWYEAGIIGLTCFLLALVSTIVLIVRTGRDDSFGSTLAVGLVLFWLASMLVSGDVNENRIFFVLLMASTGFCQSDSLTPSAVAAPEVNRLKQALLAPPIARKPLIAKDFTTPVSTRVGDLT